MEREPKPINLTVVVKCSSCDFKREIKVVNNNYESRQMAVEYAELQQELHEKKTGHVVFINTSYSSVGNNLLK